MAQVECVAIDSQGREFDLSPLGLPDYVGNYKATVREFAACPCIQYLNPLHKLTTLTSGHR